EIAQKPRLDSVVKCMGSEPILDAAGHPDAARVDAAQQPPSLAMNYLFIGSTAVASGASFEGVVRSDREQRGRRQWLGVDADGDAVIARLIGRVGGVIRFGQRTDDAQRILPNRVPDAHSL